MNRVGAVTYFISAWNYDMAAPATVEPYVVCAAR
jgi:hypothetical protein